MSSWAMSPKRDILSPLRKEEKKFTADEEEPTFRPNIQVSEQSAVLRSKARSAGYGKVLAKNPDRPEKQEEVPTFRPKLPADAKRATAKSSGYGRQAVVPKKVAEEPLPTFRPETPTSKKHQELKSKAPSSNYGKQLAQKKPRPQAPRESFTPQLTSNARLRAKAHSSQYGRKVPEPRPSSAPASRDQSGLFKREPILRYTLAQDKGKAEGPPPEPEKNFVLDGVNVALTAAHKKYEPPAAYSKHNLSPTAQAIKEKAHSSKYGTQDYQLPVGKKAAVPESPKPISTGNAKIPEELPPRPNTAPASRKARSHGYGTAEYQPPQGERREPPSEPVWRCDTAGPRPLNMPEPPAKSPLGQTMAQKVRSSGYGPAGAYTPVRGEKKEVLGSSEPEWASVATHVSPIRPLEELEPPPKTNRPSTGKVLAGLGLTAPVANGRSGAASGAEEEEAEEEEDEEDEEEDGDDDDATY